jgi:hypothetical protein
MPRFAASGTGLAGSGFARGSRVMRRQGLLPEGSPPPKDDLPTVRYGSPPDCVRASQHPAPAPKQPDPLLEGKWPLRYYHLWLEAGFRNLGLRSQLEEILNGGFTLLGTVGKGRLHDQV